MSTIIRTKSSMQTAADTPTIAMNGNEFEEDASGGNEELVVGVGEEVLAEGVTEGLTVGRDEDDVGEDVGGSVIGSH